MNPPLTGVPPETEPGADEIMAENSPNLGKETWPGPGSRASPDQEEPQIHTKISMIKWQKLKRKSYRQQEKNRYKEIP